MVILKNITAYYVYFNIIGLDDIINEQWSNERYFLLKYFFFQHQERAIYIYSYRV